jgi:ABC-type phosphate transport system permease subunit
MTDSNMTAATAVTKINQGTDAGVLDLTPLTDRGDARVRRIFFGLASVSLVIMALIVLFLFKEGVGIFKPSG